MSNVLTAGKISFLLDVKQSLAAGAGSMFSAIIKWFQISDMASP